MNNDRTFGVEIEVIRPINVTYETLADIIDAAGVPCLAEGYHHNVRRKWRVTSDNSLNHMGAEIVSPILSGEDGLLEVAKVCNALKDAGCTVDIGCGIHVHIGMADCNVKQIKNVCLNFLNWEPMFDLILPESRRGNRNTYIRSNRGHFRECNEEIFSKETLLAGFAALKDVTTMSSLHRRWQDIRYYKLNLECFSRQGTIEFRHHSGTTDAEKVCNWVRLLMAMTCQSINGSPRPVAQTPETAFNMFFSLVKEAKPLRPYYVARWNELSGKRRKVERQAAMPQVTA